MSEIQQPSLAEVSQKQAPDVHHVKPEGNKLEQAKGLWEIVKNNPRAVFEAFIQDPKKLRRKNDPVSIKAESLRWELKDKDLARKRFEQYGVDSNKGLEVVEYFRQNLTVIEGGFETISGEEYGVKKPYVLDFGDTLSIADFVREVENPTELLSELSSVISYGHVYRSSFHYLLKYVSEVAQLEQLKDVVNYYSHFVSLQKINVNLMEPFYQQQGQLENNHSGQGVGLVDPLTEMLSLAGADRNLLTRENAVQIELMWNKAYEDELLPISAVPYLSQITADQGMNSGFGEIVEHNHLTAKQFVGFVEKRNVTKQVVNMLMFLKEHVPEVLELQQKGIEVGEFVWEMDHNPESIQKLLERRPIFQKELLLSAVDDGAKAELIGELRRYGLIGYAQTLAESRISLESLKQYFSLNPQQRQELSQLAAHFEQEYLLINCSGKNKDLVGALSYLVKNESSRIRIEDFLNQVQDYYGSFYVDKRHFSTAFFEIIGENLSNNDFSMDTFLSSDGKLTEQFLDHLDRGEGGGIYFLLAILNNDLSSVFESGTDEGKRYWEFMRDHPHRHIIHEFVRDHRERMGDYIVNGLVTNILLSEMVLFEKSNGHVLRNLLTDRVLEQMNVNDRQFWEYWKEYERESSALVFLVRNKSEFDQFLVEGGKEEIISDGNVFKFLLKQGGYEQAEKFVKKWGREQWKDYLGESNFRALLADLPTQTDEARNAFTHNQYDRTSELVSFFLKNNGEDFASINSDNFSEIVGNYIREFGMAKSSLLFHYYANLKLKELAQEKMLPEDIVRSGISSTHELMERFNRLEQIVFADKPLLAEDLSKMTDFEKGLLVTITGKDRHRFDGGRPSFTSILERFEHQLAANEISPLADGYRPEEVVLRKSEIVFDADKVVADFNQLRSEILSGIDGSDNLDDVMIEYEAHLQTRAKDVEETLKKIPVEKHQFIQKEVDKISQLKAQLGKIKTVEGLLTQLIQNPFGKGDKQIYQSLVRKLLFKKLFQRHSSPHFIENMRSGLKGEQVEVQSLLTVLNVVDEMVKMHLLNLDNNNQEKYWSDDIFSLLSDKKTRDGFEGLFTNAGRIRKEVNEFQEVLQEGSFDMRFIPDKGLIGEMAGYLADVCYTKESPLLSRWPVVPYKFVTVEDGVRKFIGSVLVFEERDVKDNLCLLIRAFDVPEESKYPMGEMIESFINTLELVGEKRGASKIIAAGTNGTISNYQMTTNHFVSRYVKEENKVPLKERFDFNGYDITNSCYLVRDLNVRNS